VADGGGGFGRLDHRQRQDERVPCRDRCGDADGLRVGRGPDQTPTPFTDERGHGHSPSYSTQRVPSGCEDQPVVPSGTVTTFASMFFAVTVPSPKIANLRSRLVRSEATSTTAASGLRFARSEEHTS